MTISKSHDDYPITPHVPVDSVKIPFEAIELIARIVNENQYESHTPDGINILTLRDVLIASGCMERRDDMLCPINTHSGQKIPVDSIVMSERFVRLCSGWAIRLMKRVV